jgi:hypothetical protein
MPAKKPRPKLLRDSLRELGYATTAQSFTALVLDTFNHEWSTFSVDDLLCRPDDAVTFCGQVRLRVEQCESEVARIRGLKRIPHELFLRTLVGARKRKGLKHDAGSKKDAGVGTDEAGA